MPTNEIVAALFLGGPLDSVIYPVETIASKVQFELYGVHYFYDRHWLKIGKPVSTQPTAFDAHVFALREMIDLAESVESHLGTIKIIEKENYLGMNSNRLETLIRRLGRPYRSLSQAQCEIDEEFWKNPNNRRLARLRLQSPRFKKTRGS